MRKTGLVIAGLAAVAGVIGVVLFVYWMGDNNYNPLDYARITQVDYRAEVVDEPGGEGKVLVTERLVYEIHAGSKSNLFWELWRDLPEESIDGVKNEFTVNSVKQVFDDGTELVYEESPRLYWEDSDYVASSRGLGPGKWYHSEGPYSESWRQYECVFFYVDGLYRETVVFEIEYEMTNAALRYADCSELYLVPFSEHDVNYLTAFTGQILIPDDLMPAAGNYAAYTYGTNAETFPFEESDTENPGYHTFMFQLDRSQLKFKPYNEYIEFSLIAYGEDKHSFTSYASVNDYYDDDVLEEYYEEHEYYTALPGTYRTAKLIVLAAGVAVALLAVNYARRVHRRMDKKYKLYTPATSYETYKTVPGELDPNLAAELVFCRHKRPREAQDAYAAVLLSLARKGYIELAKIRQAGDWAFHNVKILVVEQAEESGREKKPLTYTEELYFDLILRHAHGEALPLSAFETRVADDYEYTDDFLRNTENALGNMGISQGYFQKLDYKQPARRAKGWGIDLGVFGALLLIVGNLVSYRTRLDLAFGAFFIAGIGLAVSGVLLYRESGKFVLLTQYGEDEYAKWRGFYNYLQSTSFISECSVADLRTWELYLIYATAFGIADKVTEALNVYCQYTDMSPILYNAYYRSRDLLDYYRRFRSATRRAANTAREEVGTRSHGAHGSGSGGFGGGGRGGGGGGGGH